jgi:iron complex transport system substrate-binding protein
MELEKLDPYRKLYLIDKIQKFDPDKIIIMPCGFDIERTLLKSIILRNDENWNSLKAAEMNEVYLVNATLLHYSSFPNTFN